MGKKVYVRVSLSLEEDLLKRIDERAAELCLSRSGFIAMSCAEKLRQDALLDTLPNALASLSKLSADSSVRSVDDEEGGEAAYEVSDGAIFV